MSRVFIVTNQHKWSAERRQPMPAFDFTTASDFGEVSFLLSPTARPFGPLLPVLVEELHDKLSVYTREDYLLLVGNPCLIGMCVAIAACYSGGVVNMLQWHGGDKRYIPVHVDLHIYQEESEDGN